VKGKASPLEVALGLKGVVEALQVTRKDKSRQTSVAGSAGTAP